jgi:hypothetical protein
VKKLIVLDCEVYPNYFLVALKDIESGKIITIEITDTDRGLKPDDLRLLNSLMQSRTTFGFNSVNYDLPVILYALKGKSAKEIHILSDYIIKSNSYSWQTMKKFGLYKPKNVKHFDISEPSPGVMISLKLYGGRMHSKTLQDLPIEPGTHLSPEEMRITKLYCINDLETTIDLFNNIKDRIKLRFDLAADYGDIVLSKSDAQIAEVVIKSELQLDSVKKPKMDKDKKFKYNVPEFISFKSEILKNALAIIKNHEFELDGRGSIKLPKEISNLKIKMGYSTYKLGIGGIHSQEAKQCIVPNEYQLLIDKDVAAYYPTIILNLKLFPRHLGPSFLKVYSNIVKRRLEAKKNKNKVMDDSLKIVINGSFGKFGNKYSALYSPDLMLAVTLTGQLALLMLIEQLEEAGISVISANTDGFVSLLPKSKYGLYDGICFNWELDTGFTLEETKYKALYSRDVNNYMAVGLDNSIKGKGIFQPVNTIKKNPADALNKNPQAEISTIAVRDYLLNETPLEKTIKGCKDITKFLTVRSVTGGALWRGQYLGRVVRWIYSNDGSEILYKKKNKSDNNNKVAKSDGARPVMQLGNFPKDIDYPKYVEESVEILDSLGLCDF